MCSSDLAAAAAATTTVHEAAAAPAAPAALFFGCRHAGHDELYAPEWAAASAAGGPLARTAAGADRAYYARHRAEEIARVKVYKKTHRKQVRAQKRRHHEALLVATDPAEALRLHELMTKAAAELSTAEERWLALQEEQTQVADDGS